MGDMESSKQYYCICLKEQGMRNRDLFDRHGGYGYSGATSKVVYRATFRHSKKWVREHPFATNEALAWWFVKELKAIPNWWYSNPDKVKMRDYEDDINQIRYQCDLMAGQVAISKDPVNFGKN